MRTIIIIVCITTFLISCTDKLIDQGNIAFNKKEYFKALNFYKQALKKNPTNTRLHKKIKSTVQAINIEALHLFKKGKYESVLTYLNPIVKGKKHININSFMIAGFSHFYSAKYNIQKIVNGFREINRALRMNPRQFKVAMFSKKSIDWLTKQGLRKEDITAKSFIARDVGVIYRGFVYYDLAKNITMQTTPNFPIPKALKTPSKERLKNIYKVFSWVKHNIKYVNNTNQDYYPALVTETLTRSYGTTQEMLSLIVMLLYQLDTPSYILTSKEHKFSPLLLANIGHSFILFDIEKGTPVLTDNEQLASYEAILQTPSKISLKSHNVKDLQKSNIWVVVSPRSIIPKFSLFSYVKQVYNIDVHPYFYINMYSCARIIKRGLLKNKERTYNYFKQDEKKASVSFYPHYFKLWKIYNEEKTREALEKKRSFFLRIREIKIKQLVTKEANANIFEKLLFSKREEDKEFARFNMLLLGQKTYTKDAEAQYKNFLTKYPNSRWKSLLDAHMGKLAALAGKKNLAKKYYLASGIIATEAMKYYITRKK